VLESLLTKAGRARTKGMTEMTKATENCMMNVYEGSVCLLVNKPKNRLGSLKVKGKGIREKMLTLKRT
jgi:hypothetical protein